MLRRLLLLVPAGAVGGHLLGYALTGHGHAAAVPHAHLPALALVALPLALVGLAAAAVRRELPSLRHVVTLVAGQSAAYLALEILERLPAVDAAMLLDPAVLAGFAAQVLVGWALAAGARFAVVEVDRFRGTAPLAVVDVRPPAAPGRSLGPTGERNWTPYVGRAPPHLLVA